MLDTNRPGLSCFLVVCHLDTQAFSTVCNAAVHHNPVMPKLGTLNEPNRFHREISNLWLKEFRVEHWFCTQGRCKRLEARTWNFLRASTKVSADCQKALLAKTRRACACHGPSGNLPGTIHEHTHL